MLRYYLNILDFLSTLSRLDLFPIGRCLEFIIYKIGPKTCTGSQWPKLGMWLWEEFVIRFIVLVVIDLRLPVLATMVRTLEKLR